MLGVSVSVSGGTKLDGGEAGGWLALGGVRARDMDWAWAKQ